MTTRSHFASAEIRGSEIRTVEGFGDSVCRRGSHSDSDSPQGKQLLGDPLPLRSGRPGDLAPAARERRMVHRHAQDQLVWAGQASQRISLRPRGRSTGRHLRRTFPMVYSPDVAPADRPDALSTAPCAANPTSIPPYGWFCLVPYADETHAHEGSKMHGGATQARNGSRSSPIS